MKKFTINYNGKDIEVNEGEIFKNIVEEEDAVLCILNGTDFELTQKIPYSGRMEILTSNTEVGWNIYSRTLQYIFIKASLDIFKDAKIVIQHSISRGIFGEILKEGELTEEDISLIKKRMQELIDKDIKINKISVPREKAIEIFKNYNMLDKVKLLSQIELQNVSLYELDGRYDYFYGPMAYSTGIIKAYDLIKYAHGFVLRNPEKENVNILGKFIEQKGLAKVFYETEEWLNVLGIGEVGSLNEKVLSREKKELMLTSEALHEKKIAYIADNIVKKPSIKMVLIAGPSSSGKTTFANRLGIQLRVNGLVPVKISLDDYFVEREFTPRDENGDYNFECIEAIDIKLFNENLIDILNGKKVRLPSYNFKTGKREWYKEEFEFPKNGILIVEGIHGLNPLLTEKIPAENKYKVYISALTQLNIDNHNRIATTDVRKVRRIVRDYLSRGYDAEETLKMWPSIKKGEKKNIFVFQEEADDMFNSTLPYELCVLKPYAIQQLDKIGPESPVYGEAIRLKSFLSFFKEISVNDVLGNSILREFIGGSYFYEY
ncbi:MAG: nucleoside kinase [Clostridium sp.]|nr:nucleoside kinase [Clostridium sp.]MDY3827748.1 nucleoside kinase [Clostridium sp.]